MRRRRLGVHASLATASALAFLALCFPIVTNAGSSSGTLSVHADVGQHCSLSSPTLDFGGYNPITTNATANLDGAATISVTCAVPSSVTLAFDLGVNALGGHCGASPQRCLANGTNYLNYNIYASASDRSSGVPWSAAVAETVSGPSETVSIYGRVPGGQDASVGTYTDSVVATVSY